MIKHYFLWSGMGAVEEIDENWPNDKASSVEEAVASPVTREQALQALQAKTTGDWTLWYREGDRCVLVAVHVRRWPGTRILAEDVSRGNSTGVIIEFEHPNSPQ